MNPPLQINSSKSTSISNSSGHQKMSGFASLINLKDECAVTRGRRIQISQLSSKSNKIATEEMGPAIKKRWSFHSSNQITDLLKEDKVMKPISSPKRRKSSGSSLARSASDTYTFIDEIGSGKSHSLMMPVSKEISRSSRHVLSSSSHQLQSKRLPCYRRGKLMPLREAEASSSKSKYTLDPYLIHMDVYPCDYPRSSKYKRSREVVGPDYISTMPDEVLLRICKFLPKAALANLARTSHRFLGLIQDDTLWKRLCVMGKLLNPEHLLIIMSRKPIYLRMARASIPDPDEVPSNLSSLISASQLTHLDLSAAKISVSTLALIMKISPKLVKLSLEHLRVPKEVMECMTFVNTIEVLNLTMCYELDANALVNFLNRCQRLKELNIGCVQVDWGHEGLTNVVKALPSTMQQLNISGFRNLLDNSHVQIISNRCPKLLELDISDSQEVQAKSIEYFLRLTKLQHLGLSRCYGIDAPVYTLLANHKSLKYIDLFSLFKENSLRQLSSSLPGIEINKFPFSAIARPTVGNKRSSIWLQRVRD